MNSETVLLASRRLARSPLFSITVILTLSLALTGVISGYSIIDSVLLRPLPYEDPTRLVAISLSGPGLSVGSGDNSEASYAFYKAHSKTLQAVAAYAQNVVSLSDEREPEQAKVALVSSNVFSMLGIKPLYGNLFSESDDLPSGSDVVLISSELWERRYGGQPSIVGKVIELNRAKKRVIGILPRGFDFPEAGTAVWYPLGVDLASPDAEDWYLKVIGRLTPGDSEITARVELQRLLTPLRETYPAVPAFAGHTPLEVRIVPLREFINRNSKAILRIVFAVSSFVLLLVLANLANLFLVRAEYRKPEAAVQIALGAERWRVAVDFLTESILLVIPATVLALAFVFVGTRWRFGLDVSQIPRLSNVRVGGGVVGFAVVLLVCISMFFALMSYLRIQVANLSTALRAASSRSMQSNTQVQRFAVVLQVAIAMILLAGAMGTLRSVVNLKKVPLGMDVSGVVTGDLSLPYEPYADFEHEQRFFGDVRSALEQLPGTIDSGVVSTLPLTPPSQESLMSVVDRSSAVLTSDKNRFALSTLAAPGYFKTLGIPILHGRSFAPGDSDNVLHPVIISESLSLQVFGLPDSIGRILRIGGATSQTDCMILGIVGDVPGQKIERSAAKIVYFPLVQPTNKPTWVPTIPRNFSIALRSTLPASEAARLLRQTVRNIDPKLPLTRVQPMTRLIGESTSESRIAASIVGSGAGLALLLGLVGIYGITAHAVSRRTREMGLRIALGAQGSDVIAAIVGSTARMVLTGIVVGLAAIVILAPYVEGLLFEVSLREPLTLVLVAVGLFVFALTISYIPAQSVSKLEPVIALRTE